MTGAKTKELKARLGDPAKLPSVDDTKAWIADRLSHRLKGFVAEREAKHRKQSLALEHRRERMVQRHRNARSDLKLRHEERWKVEARERSNRLPKGVKGLWSWITGKSRQIKLRNEAETVLAQDRDRKGEASAHPRSAFRSAQASETDHRAQRPPPRSNGGTQPRRRPGHDDGRQGSDGNH